MIHRRHKAPRRYEQGLARAKFPTSPKEEYRHIYFEVLDLAVTSISSRFDQKDFKPFSDVEQLLFKACKGKEFRDELTKVCEIFYSDFDEAELEVELLTLQ